MKPAGFVLYYRVKDKEPNSKNEFGSFFNHPPLIPVFYYIGIQK